MTHELKYIVQQFENRHKEGRKAVLATVVDLDGSSYRRPGVRMLLFDDGKMVGAVSGGCVEKEVFRQANSVFETGISKIMIYDGRYRLGCEGILYILLEEFKPTEAFCKAFWSTIAKRKSFEITSTYLKEPATSNGFRTIFQFDGNSFAVNSNSSILEETQLEFSQVMQPCFQLIIIGAEHDAVQLCKYAALTGWEVTIVVNPREEKSELDFPGSHKMVHVEPEMYLPEFDAQTAVVLMTHSYVKDLQFLLKLKDTNAAYFGLLGPYRRREKLFDELMERCPDVREDFLELVHGPAGVDIGAETPEEIANSIISEILAVVRKREPSLLKHRMGSIHS